MFLLLDDFIDLLFLFDIDIYFSSKVIPKMSNIQTTQYNKCKQKNIVFASIDFSLFVICVHKKN